MSIDWESLRMQYVQNPTTSLEAVAVDANVDVTHLKKVAAENHWYDQKKEFRKLTNQKASEKLLTDIVDMESDNIVERGRIRLQNWRLIQGNLMAVVSKLNVVDDLTGLPNPLTPTQLERAAKTLKDVTQALERAHLGERLELGQPTNVNESDSETMRKFQEFMEWEKLTSGKSNEELIKEIDKLLQQRKDEEETAEFDNQFKGL